MTMSRKALIVDREGATAVWSLLIPVAERLEQEGWEVGIVTMTDHTGRKLPTVSCSLGIHEISVPQKRWFGDLFRQRWVFKREFARLLERVRPSVVHVNFAIPGIWARRVAKQEGVPWLLATQHELYGSMAWHLRLGLMATKHLVDVHTYVSRTVAESFGQINIEQVEAGEGFPRHWVIRNGVDAAAIQRFSGGAEGRIPGRIVAPGRLVPEKGQTLLIRAVARIRELRPWIHLHIAGTGPEEARLKGLVQELDIAEAVHFEGWLPSDQLWPLLSGAQVGAFTSDGRQEGFGLALAEAALLETPMVASCIAAFREVLGDDEEAAYWFRPDYEDDLTHKLCLVLDAPAEKGNRRAERARKLAERRASLSVMLNSYSDLYRMISASLGCNFEGRSYD